MRFILTYFDGIDSDEIGRYDTIKDALADARHWKFKRYEIYDTLEDRLLIDYED